MCSLNLLSFQFLITVSYFGATDSKQETKWSMLVFWHTMSYKRLIDVFRNFIGIVGEGEWCLHPPAHYSDGLIGHLMQDKQECIPCLSMPHESWELKDFCNLPALSRICIRKVDQECSVYTSETELKSNILAVVSLHWTITHTI